MINYYISFLGNLTISKLLNWNEFLCFVSMAWSWEFSPLQTGLVNFSSPASPGLIQLGFHADFVVPLCRSKKEGETPSQIKVKVVRCYCFTRSRLSSCSGWTWLCSLDVLLWLSCPITSFCESSSHGLQLLFTGHRALDTLWSRNSWFWAFVNHGMEWLWGWECKPWALPAVISIVEAHNSAVVFSKSKQAEDSCMFYRTAVSPNLFVRLEMIINEESNTEF